MTNSGGSPFGQTADRHAGLRAVPGTGATNSPPLSFLPPPPPPPPSMPSAPLAPMMAAPPRVSSSAQGGITPVQNRAAGFVAAPMDSHEKHWRELMAFLASLQRKPPEYTTAPALFLKEFVKQSVSSVSIREDQAVVNLQAYKQPIVIAQDEVGIILDADEEMSMECALAQANMAVAAGMTSVQATGNDHDCVMLYLAAQRVGLSVSNAFDIEKIKVRDPQSWQKAEEAFNGPSKPAMQKELTPEDAKTTLQKVCGEAANELGLITKEQQDTAALVQACSVALAGKAGESEVPKMRGRAASEILQDIEAACKKNKIDGLALQDAQALIAGGGELPKGSPQFGGLLLDLGFIEKDIKNRLLVAQAAVRAHEAIYAHRMGESPSAPEGMDEKRLFGHLERTPPLTGPDIDAQKNYKDVWDAVRSGVPHDLDHEKQIATTQLEETADFFKGYQAELASKFATLQAGGDLAGCARLNEIFEGCQNAVENIEIAVRSYKGLYVPPSAPRVVPAAAPAPSGP